MEQIKEEPKALRLSNIEGAKKVQSSIRDKAPEGN